MPRIKKKQAGYMIGTLFFRKDRCSKNPYPVFACSAIMTSSHFNKKKKRLKHFYLNFFFSFVPSLTLPFSYCTFKLSVKAVLLPVTS